MTTAPAEFDAKDPVGSFASTWQRVIFEPRAFFDSLPPAGGLQPPFFFALICVAIGAFGFMIFGGGIRGFLGLLIIGAARLFIGASIVALVAQYLFEGRGDYEASFRVLAYSTAVAVVIGIPIVKYFAALYGAYLVIIGLAKAHGFDTVRALLTALVSVFVGMVLVHALFLGRFVHHANPLLR
jgi:hypothetical protein